MLIGIKDYEVQVDVNDELLMAKMDVRFDYTSDNKYCKQCY